MWQLLASKLLPLNQCRRCGRLDDSVLIPDCGGMCELCWIDLWFPGNFRPVTSKEGKNDG